MVNSVVKGDFRAFEVPLSDIGRGDTMNFNKTPNLIEFCLLIQNIRPKVLNSVVKGVRRTFKVPLLDIAHLYFTCNSGSVWITLVFCKLVPTDSEYMKQKELAGYSRVPGSSHQKTDFGRFRSHPTFTVTLYFFY